ncbi:hypothetical protein I5M07_11430 [Flavobacterium sp. SE-1-e]|uniref:Uncharacterized protein n=1 Tax=Flavobacterium agrisoli TaxID=2793066 RepID=A0A934PPB7_9FLAO|nr:hypothetical protein [Flavobacterium agrisoli]
MFIKPLFPVVEYVVSYDYIANVLCENKAKPQMQCNGKCHLIKELAKASDTPEKGNDKKQPSFENTIIFYQEIESHFTFKVAYYTKTIKIPSDYNLSYSFLKTNAVFRPPVV